MRHDRLAASVTMLSIAMIAAFAGIALPATAVAAPKVPALASLSAVVGVGSTGQGTLIVTGVLPTSVTLPAQMIVPIPAGLKPSWVGEIVGTDPAKDPTAKYTIASGKKYDTVTLEMRASRTGQVEFTRALPVVGGGTLYSLDLPILSQVGLATLSFRVPSGSQVASVSAGVTFQQGAGGTDLYSVTKTKPAVGKTVSGRLTVPSSGGTATGTAQPAAAAGSTGSSISQMVALLIAALVGFGVVTFIGYVRDRGLTGNSEES